MTLFNIPKRKACEFIKTIKKIIETKFFKLTTVKDYYF